MNLAASAAWLLLEAIAELAVATKRMDLLHEKACIQPLFQSGAQGCIEGKEKYSDFTLVPKDARL